MPDLDPGSLGDAAAVEALCGVAKQWISARGLEAFVAVDGAKSAAAESYQDTPAWAHGTPSVTAEAGDFARRMLRILVDSEDGEVEVWTRQAIEDVRVSRAEIDPITLSIGARF